LGKKRRWQFDLRTLMCWMCLAAMIAAIMVALPPQSAISGPLFLLAKFDAAVDRGIVYGWASLNLLAIAAYPAWPRRWAAIMTACGIAVWTISGLFVRYSIDW
jgi:hypothetical protein